jgi:hypothetical protein
MPQEALELSKEARRVYLIALEVRQHNPERADRLVARVRRMAQQVRVMVAVRTLPAR